MNFISFGSHGGSGAAAGTNGIAIGAVQTVGISVGGHGATIPTGVAGRAGPDSDSATVEQQRTAATRQLGDDRNGPRVNLRLTKRLGPRLVARGLNGHTILLPR